MLTTPDAPINFANDPDITDSTQIGLTWEPSPSDGGSEVLDYTLMWDRAIDSYEIYDIGITSTSYTVGGLTSSLQYSFKISSRNEYGQSVYTEPITILSANVPYQPTAPTTSFVGSNLVISWIPPVSGGSPVLGYKVMVK
jgi:large repetitive protein